MKYSNLLAIIQFIYIGQTDVDHESLELFMIDAQELGIRGLTNSFNEPTNDNSVTENVCDVSDTNAFAIET